MKATWLHAGSQRAEAGYEDPALGWVGVRADLAGGGVHAAVMPASGDAAQALGSHLAGLNAYLSQHGTPVNSVTLDQPDANGVGAGAGGTQHGPQQQAGEDAGQSAAAHSPSNGEGRLASGDAASPPARSSAADAAEGMQRLKGSAISVMA
jgi:hypothetical protein